MAKCQLKIKAVSPWWMPIYIQGLAICCLIANREPDYDKVSDFITRHIKLKIVKEKA